MIIHPILVLAVTLQQDR